MQNDSQDETRQDLIREPHCSGLRLSPLSNISVLLLLLLSPPSISNTLPGYLAYYPLGTVPIDLLFLASLFNTKWLSTRSSQEYPPSKIPIQPCSGFRRRSLSPSPSPSPSAHSFTHSLTHSLICPSFPPPLNQRLRNPHTCRYQLPFHILSTSSLRANHLNDQSQPLNPVPVTE